METKIEFSDFRGFIRRRKKIFALTFFLLFSLIAVRTITLPPVYRSQATILIEGQQMPQDYVKPTATSDAEERISLITRQVMSRSKLMEIVNKFNLYQSLREKGTPDDAIIETMKEAIKFETIREDVIDKGTGRQSQVTIAFSLAYEGNDPVRVQQVTAELASLYLRKDITNREEHASSATSFFRKEAENLNKKVRNQESKIGAFKKDHIGELPEDNTFNLQALGRLEPDEDRISSNIRAVQEKIVRLKEQIAVVPPLAPVVVDNGRTVLSPRERLKQLRLELIRLQSSVSEKHPDLRKVKREIKELELQVRTPDDSDSKIRNLDNLQGQLAELKGRLGPKHPDVLKLSKEVAKLREEVARIPQKKEYPSIIALDQPDNPAYLALRTEIVAAEAELKGLMEEKKSIKGMISGYEKKLRNAPVVGREYNMLLQDYESTKSKYGEIMNKLMEAEAAEEMETSQRGERLTIIEPARLPETPYKPNRKVLLMMGMVLALGAGAGLAGFRELTDHSVKTPVGLQGITGIPVLSVISFVENNADRRRRHMKQAFGFLAVGSAVFLGVVGVHWYVMPLNEVWVKIVQKLGSMLPLNEVWAKIVR